MECWLSFQRDTCVINGYCFVANDINPYVSCLKCLPGNSTTSWTPAGCNSYMYNCHMTWWIGGVVVRMNE